MGELDELFKSMILDSLKTKPKGEQMEETEDQKKKKNTFKNVTFENKGKKIVLPSDPRNMSPKEAIEQLERLQEQENQEVGINEEVACFPLEGAYALMKVLESRYGWVNTEKTDPKGFFSPAKPPIMVTLEVGFQQTAQVFWGAFSVPGVEGKFESSAQMTRQGPRFVLTGRVKKKYQKEIQELANEIRNFVAENSLYKGNAIRITTVEYEDQNGSHEDGRYVVDHEQPPRFMDLSDVKKTQLIFSEAVREQIDTSIFTPIEKTQACRDAGIPLKRGVLLAGPFGTGKTLTAQVAALKCVENGWTFIYLDRAAALKEVLVFARQYMPAVIFAEDIDRAIPAGRSVEVDDILNHIDGIDSKGTEIMTVFTTNEIENIERAMLRPGRLDAVINVLPPDAEAAQKLMHMYGKGLIGKDENLAAAGKALEGQIPASIREVVERSKLYAIRHLKEGGKLKITGKDLVLAAQGIKQHLDLINPPAKKSDVPLGVAVSDGIATILENNMRKRQNGELPSLDSLQ